MPSSKGYGTPNAESPLAPVSFTRREPGATEILIEILYTGVCHSDLHMARNEWGQSIYPLVPGHEILGRVSAAGSKVTKFKVGDIAAVGVIVDSCRKCAPCKKGEEHFCDEGATLTYAAKDRVDGSITMGGYSNNYVVDERFAHTVPSNLDMAGVAPLLCAGITTYSPLRHWKVGPGMKVGIIGLGADEVILSTDEAQMKAHAGSFDFILNAVSAPHKLEPYLALLKQDATMTLVGLPEKPPSVDVFSLISKRVSIAGSMIGGMIETQEMLDYCGKHNITADVEVIPIQKVNEAFERMLKQDVKYRFVIDMSTLK